ncbi:complex I 24 kDa subunit family protein [Breznakiella homolactica]|uniref:NAD(P)H-dependent oxidoreductase subunit E n=1 Tax=Breznakiella homolactica TaxID=2798577 RepID=A0A7T7XRC7_9SPIR|nr:NAD(P)H-dependent oxidoreductase subunit E [Breznakiella homolactica]QQO11034.1 NAD(P)H-dependent oxidoreductase subunit E [Breznakiella homolactica]
MAAAGATLSHDAGSQGNIDFPQELTAFIDEWKAKPGSLIMILHKIQETFGFIPRAAAEKLALVSGIPLARIYGVITFYHYFKTTKPGKHRISVCLGTACYLKGGQDLIDEARSILSLAEDGVTEDGLFSIDPVRCVGCCGLAPVITVGNDTYGKLTKDQLPEIIAKYQNG